jgi:hypothetical protein
MDQRAFMLDPASWPGTSCPRIYLKNYGGAQMDDMPAGFPQLGQLLYQDGNYLFVPNSTFANPNLKEIRTGGVELIDQILKAGWEVD